MTEQCLLHLIGLLENVPYILLISLDFRPKTTCTVQFTFSHTGSDIRTGWGVDTWLFIDQTLWQLFTCLFLCGFVCLFVCLFSCTLQKILG